jgi:two-component system sensor histidine kinase BaeS
VLAVVAISVLAVGTLTAALLIFGPARRRLRAVEGAARRLGHGDLTARAPSQGGDEIAAVASAFNAMADDLARRAEALAASDRVRRQLLADVSHELTTPVTAIRGYLETLTMAELTLDDETRRRYLGIVTDETARLERIIRDLLELARLEGGGGAFSCGAVPVAAIFDRVRSRHERASQTSDVTIDTHIEPGAETVWADQDRLEQAVQNLAANAIRHAPPGSSIALRAIRSGDAVELKVEDEGPGIAPEHLPHVFDRFYKAEPSRAVAGGTQGAEAAASNGSGLGLSIVKAIAERHGGRIDVDSTPGHTVFTLRIPAPVR